MISAILKYQFLQNAVAAGILASIVCGIIGAVILEKKLIMLSGGIAHTSYGGVGLGYLLGFEPILGAFLFAIGGAFAIGTLSRKKHTYTDVIIGLFWSFGMALGILFVSLMPGYPPDLNSYLFGNILSVRHNDLYMMSGLTLIVVLAIFLFFDTWKAYLFDEEFASISGIRTNILKRVLLVLIAMAVVALIRVVGIILVLALLTAPAAIAGLLTQNFEHRIIAAILVGIVLSFAGLFLSYTLNIASGASIVILLVVCYLLAFIIHSLREKKGKTGFVS